MSSTTLTVFIDFSDIAVPRMSEIVVVNPDPGGTTEPRLLTVKAPGGDAGTLSFTSAPTSSLNPAMVGDTITFTTAATDAAGGLPTYMWNFGDGTSAPSASVMHAYAARGLYNVTVTALSGASTLTSGLVQAVDAPSGVTGAIANQKGQIAFNLSPKKPGNDKLLIAGTVPLPANFSPNGKVVVFNLGEVPAKTYTLNAKGTAASADKKDSFKLFGKLKSGTFSVPTATYQLELKSQDLFSGLSVFGFVNGDIKTPVTVTVPYGIAIDGNPFAGQIQFTYTAKKDKSGSAKLK